MKDDNWRGAEMVASMSEKRGTRLLYKMEKIRK